MNADDEHSKPIARVTYQGLTEIDAQLRCIRHSLRLEPRLAERHPDGSVVIGVYAHLGEFADAANRPIPVSIQIGAATITPSGETTLTLTHSVHVSQAHAG
jgi:hypothetical protein